MALVLRIRNGDAIQIGDNIFLRLDKLHDEKSGSDSLKVSVVCPKEIRVERLGFVSDIKKFNQKEK
jgi:sRNA-binding carbon storage regulator CsrA